MSTIRILRRAGEIIARIEIADSCARDAPAHPDRIAHGGVVERAADAAGVPLATAWREADDAYVTWVVGAILRG